MATVLSTRPQLGQEAPDFQAPSTMGAVSLKGNLGKWVVLFSWVRDDTPVCTNQCISFTEHQEVFKAMDAQLIGLSVDSLESHFSWLTKLDREKGVKPNFPLVADEDKKVARSYGILDEERGITVRGVFIIDPNGKLRFGAYYPMRIAPNVEEVLRVLRELRMS